MIEEKTFVENNETICQDDCHFSEYDKVNQRATCSCKPKESASSFIDMKINITKIYQQFTDIKNIINLNILKCYKKLFCLEGIKNNICLFLIFPFIIFHIIVIIIFYCNQEKKLYKKIKDIKFAIKHWHLVKKGEKKLTSEINVSKIQNNITTKSRTRNFFKTKKQKKHKNYPPKKIHRINLNNQITKNFFRKRKNDIDKKIKNKKKKIKKEIEKTMEPNDEELNKLPYKSALKKDKRNFWKFYISLIKTRHILIFSFFYNKDYNSKIIKIDLFFISFIILFATNALFFNNNTIHQIYEDQGTFNFIYQLPQIIYSSLICMVFEVLLKLLALSEDDILVFKKDMNRNTVKKRFKKLKKKLRIKFILYFVLSFLFLIFFWYYLSMFGVIYRNTQLHLIKDTLISFGLSLIYPFGIYLAPGLFRIPALSNKKHNRDILYKISLFLQMI